MAKFDSKIFNPEAFGAYVKRIPNTKKNELAKSGAVGSNDQAKNALSTQTGSLYAKVPYFGRINGGTSQNNNGATDITASSTTTFDQGFIVASRMDSWVERNFSKNITAGVDFMDNVAAQIADYKMEVRQAMLLKILEGVYGMTSTGTSVAAKAADEFKTKHTYDITSQSTKTVGAATLNSAIQKACGDNKSIFTLAIMHSAVATNLENLRLLEYLKQTDADGIQRNLSLGTWNGRLVLVDDNMPTAKVVTTQGVHTIKVTTAAAATDKFTVCGTEYSWVANGTTETDTTIALPSTNNAANEASAIQTKLAAVTSGEIANFTWTVSSDTVTGTQKTTAPDADFSASIDSSATMKATITKDATAPVIDINYTTYVLGEGAIVLDEIGDAVPYEMSRDAAKNGGQDTLFVRDRYICGVEGISFVGNITASASNSDLATGSNWNVINDGSVAIDTKAIPICKIISRG